MNTYEFSSCQNDLIKKSNLIIKFLADNSLSLLLFYISCKEKCYFLCSGLSFKDMCIADSLGRQRQCLLEATGTRGPAHHER